MTSSDSSPKLPLWVFIVSDVALLGTAAFIAMQSDRPLSPTATLAIVSCVVVGAVILFVPLVARYERQKNEMLDQRQSALEALAGTVSASAEQISIAATGLNEIAELAQKNLRHAEQLPHKLQEKIAAFQSQLTTLNDAEKEELEKELVSLRSSESERLETVVTKIAKTATELAKLEAATQQHLSAANEAVAKLSMGTASAIGKAQAAAEQALAQARTEAARGLGETAGSATKAIETAKSAALAELDAKLADAITTIVDRVTRELSSKLAPAGFVPPAAPASAPTPAVPPTTAIEAAVSGADLSASALAKTEGTAQPPKRPRKTRREEAGDSPAAEAPPASTPAASLEASAAPSAPSAEATPATAAPEEPTPIPAADIPEITPVAPHTTQPFPAAASSAPPPPAAPALESKADSASPSTARAANTPPPAASPSTGPSEDLAKTARPRPKKKAESNPDEPSLDLGLAEAPAANGSEGSAPEPGERVLSSDGATRLLVTAYIGIGNRLFIRGTGPGLSWEKGVPLQFVSIGKWRWETNDATAAVQFKLYKNDDLECTALGQQEVEPGYQQEVTATF